MTRDGRDLALAIRFSALLPKRPSILNIGTVDSGLFETYAPIIGRAQAWTFVESSAVALGRSLNAVARWAHNRGITVTWPNRALLLHRPGGAWRIEGMVAACDAIPAKAFREAHGVITQGQLEWLTPVSLEHVLRQLNAPLLVMGLQTGRATFYPRDPADRAVVSLARRSTTRDFGAGHTAGATAATLIRRTLAARGFSVTSMPYDVHWPAGSTRVIDWTAKLAVAALNARGRGGTDLESWRTRRAGLANRSKLAIRIGGIDLLAIPPTSSSPTRNTKKGR